jgi:hypothetical protein
LFDHQIDIPKSESNIRKLREKTLHKIEKAIRKKQQQKGEDPDGRRASTFGQA